MKNHEIDAPASVLRRKLMLGLPSGLALATPLALVGCGGGGGDDAPADTSPMAQAPDTKREALAIQVALPTGVAATGLVVGSGTSLARVAASGASGVVSLDGGSSMAYLLTDSGALFGMGFVGKDRPTINSRTTAEALIYLGCSPSQLGEAWQFALRKVLATHDVVLPVVVAVEAAMRRGSLEVTDANLLDAVLNAVAMIRGRDRIAAAAASEDGRERRLALSFEAVPKSGMRVIEQPGFNTIGLENAFRRRAVATVERFGYANADGAPVLEAPVKVGNDFVIDPTEALNLSNAVNAIFEKTVEDLLVALNLIGDYDLGAIPWTPKTSELFELPIEPATASHTYYRVNVVGLGAQPPARDMTLDELEMYKKLLINTLVTDLVVPIASTLLLPIAGTAAQGLVKGNNTALVAAAMGIDVARGAFATQLFPKTVAALRAGKWGDAVLGVSIDLLGNDTGKQLVSNALANLIRWAGAPTLATIRDSVGNILAVDLLSTEGDRLAKNFVSGLGKVTGWIDAVEKAMLVADVGAQAIDIGASRTLDSFEVEGSPSVVVISPESVTLSQDGGSQRFEISSVDGRAPQQGWFYEWSCASKSGFIVVGAQTSSEAAPTLLQAPDPSTLYTVKGGNTGDEIEGITVRVFNNKRQYMGRKTVQVIIERVVQGTLSPPSIAFDRGASNAQQLFTLALDPVPADATQLKYEWVCPSQFGTLQSAGVTTSIDAPRVTSDQPTATYRLASGSRGGERENVSVDVLQRVVDAGTGAQTWHKISTARATATVKSEFSLRISPPGPTDVPTESTMGITAFFNESLPAGATVAWEWSHVGAGSLEAVPADSNPADSSVNFKTAVGEGVATLTATASVTIPANGDTPTRLVNVEPVNCTLNVKKGLRTITMEVSGGIFGCTDPLACGVGAYTAYIVPRMPKAISYTAVLSGFAYPSCNRSVTWNSVKGDGGGCNFPVTYHPHTSAGATNQWAVWIGFGGAFAGTEKCIVTITLAP